MELKAFRVMNYRSVNDSGWVELEPLTVLVGKNQSGKTALLRALHKFNPYQDDPYNMDREWPRGRRNDRDPKAPAVMVRFALSEDERARLVELTGLSIPDELEIARLYDGSRVVKFDGDGGPDETHFRAVAEKIQTNFQIEGASAPLATAIAALSAEAGEMTSNGDFDGVRNLLTSVNARLTAHCSTEENLVAADAQALTTMAEIAQQIASQLPGATPLAAMEKQVIEWLPVFVYMDDYRTYIGTTFLNQLKERVDQGKESPDDETVLVLMKMAGLELDDQVEKVKIDDREQRVLDLSDASLTFTKEMEGRWSQEEYAVQFLADQYHFMTFVRAPDQNALVPLEEESRGFQWFFSFDVHLAYETQGSLKGAVLLLDEPGLHLHPKAQEDLLRRLEAYCEGNQLIYSTHLPFMIDLRKPERIRVVDRKVDGTAVTDDIFGGNEDARFSLLAKLGMSASQSLLVARYNLVVEGPEDYWYLVAMSDLLVRDGRRGLDERLQLTATGGASEAAYMATFMCGQDLNVAVLFDSDQAGETAAESLVKKWLVKYRSKQIEILRVGDLLEPVRAEATVEDLFPQSFYLPFVVDAYKKELEGKKPNLKPRKEPKLLARIEAALRDVGIDKYNKGRAAKLIREALRRKDLSDLPDELVNNFEGVFARLLQIVEKWEASSKEKD